MKTNTFCILIVAFVFTFIKCEKITFLGRSYEMSVLKSYTSIPPTQISYTTRDVKILSGGRVYNLGKDLKSHSLVSGKLQEKVAFNDKNGNTLRWQNRKPIFESQRIMKPFPIKTSNPNVFLIEGDRERNIAFLLSAEDNSPRMGKLNAFETNDTVIKNDFILTEEVDAVGKEITAISVNIKTGYILLSQATFYDEDKFQSKGFNLIELQPSSDPIGDTKKRIITPLKSPVPETKMDTTTSMAITTSKPITTIAPTTIATTTTTTTIPTTTIAPTTTTDATTTAPTTESQSEIITESNADKNNSQNNENETTPDVSSNIENDFETTVRESNEELRRLHNKYLESRISKMAYENMRLRGFAEQLNRMCMSKMPSKLPERSFPVGVSGDEEYTAAVKEVLERLVKLYNKSVRGISGEPSQEGHLLKKCESKSSALKRQLDSVMGSMRPTSARRDGSDIDTDINVIPVTDAMYLSSINENSETYTCALDTEIQQLLYKYNDIKSIVQESLTYENSNGNEEE